MTRRLPVLGLLLLPMVLLGGCKFNLDIVFPGQGALVCIKIKAKNAATESAVSGQVKRAEVDGNVVTPTYQRESGPDSQGFTIWLLKVQFGGSAPGDFRGNQTAHLGIELNDGAEWEHLDTILGKSPHPSTPQAKLQEGDGPLPLLEVANASTTVGLRVDNLEVACAPVDVPLVDLNYGDPLVASLPWVTILSTPTVFAPATSQFFPLPGAMPGSPANCFMRSIYTSESGDVGPLGVVGQLDQLDQLGLAVPALSAIGLGGLVALLVVAGLLLLATRRFRQPG